MNKRTDDYGRQSSDETLRELQTDSGHGLDGAEVGRRRDRYDYDEIQEHEGPVWHRVFRRFWGPIPWLIEAAAILSALAHKWEDFVIILVMLLLNTSLDFFQERRARLGCLRGA